MIFNDAFHLLEPEHGDLIQYLALVRNGVGQYHVKRGKPIGSYHKQGIARIKNVPDLSLSDQRQTFIFCSGYNAQAVLLSLQFNLKNLLVNLSHNDSFYYQAE
jgi:hypothetical protein